MKIIQFISKSPRKTQLFNELIRELIKEEVSDTTIMNVLLNEIEELDNEGKSDGIKITLSEIKSFIKNMDSFSAAFMTCILKEELNLLK